MMSRKFLILVLIFFSSLPLHSLEVISNIESTIIISDAVQSRIKTVPLSGKVEFYWLQLLSPDELSNGMGGDFSYEKIPSYWNAYEGVTGQGYATYHFRIRLSDTNSVYGFRMGTIGTAYRMWINGIEKASVGTVGTNKETTVPDYQTLVVFSTTDNGVLDVVIQAANFHHSRGGIWESIEFGKASNIKLFRDLKIATELFISGILLIMFLYHLNFFVKRRKDYSALFFGLSCFAVMLRTLVIGEYFLYNIFPQETWYFFTKVEYISVNIAIVTLVGFIVSLYYKFSIPFITRLIVILFGLNVAVNLLTPIRIFSNTMWSFFIIAFLSGIYAFAVLVRATIKKVENAAILLIAVIVYMVFAVNELLFATSHLLRFGWLMPVGHFILVLVQAYIISERLFKAFQTAEDLTLHVERKVEVRTADLHRTNMELEKMKNQIEKERNLLWQKSLEIENDLEFAREVQKNFIPDRTPKPNLSFFYQPMEKVGGDYFDFVIFPTGIGVFISDVSGHGIAAALITSTIKSFFQQFSAISIDPAQFLYRLNEFLIDLTGEHFVTAFYGILNERTGEFTYSNAGHPPPLLIGSSSISYINSSRLGFILGAFDKDYMRDMNFNFKNRSIKLSTGDQILFYTDGISEAFPFGSNNFANDELYGNSRFISDLEELRSGDNEIRTDDIISNLIKFRGSEQFEDDICLISLKINTLPEKRKSFR